MYSRNTMRPYTTYSYIDDCLVVSYKRKAMLKITGKSRKDAFIYVKEKETEILKAIVAILKKESEVS